MPETIFKAGTQAQDDPWEFVLSTPTPDSYGDIVEPSWNLKPFKQNPIALWMHDSDEPVGTWTRIRMEGNALRARLNLAAAGTSELIDRVRSLIEQRVLRACSVGFRPGKAEPIDPEKPWAGFRLTDNLLLEASVVSVPANPDALNTRSRCAVGDSRCNKSAWTQLRGSGVIVPKTKIYTGDTPMTLAERIQAQEEALASLREKADTIMSRSDDMGILSDDDQTALDGLTDQMGKVQRSLTTLQSQEQIRAGQVAGAGQRPTTDPKPVPRIVTRQSRQDLPAHGAMMAIACVLKGISNRVDPIQLAEQTFPDDKAIPMLVRTASAPADASTAAWAEYLVEEEWGPFWALVRDASIYGQIPGRRMEVTDLTNMPVQAGRGALAAGFIAAGSPIPVKKGTVAISTVQPHKLAVISAYLNELIRRRTVVDIATYIRGQVIGDTAEAIDTVLISNTARSAGTTPAGLQDTTETGAGNINAATNAATGAGNATDLEIIQDAASLMGRVNAIKINSGVWVMHPNQVRALRGKMNATTGHYVFREDINAGRFEGFPIVSSTNMTAGVVAFIGDDSMVLANQLMPEFAESRDATLHFEDTTPLAIGTAGSPNTVAAPTRSLFQEDMTAIRMLAFMDWRVVRQAGVQIISGASAW